VQSAGPLSAAGKFFAKNVGFLTQATLKAAFVRYIGLNIVFLSYKSFLCVALQTRCTKFAPNDHRKGLPDPYFLKTQRRKHHD